jgi:hypothetical protein
MMIDINQEVVIITRTIRRVRLSGKDIWALLNRELEFQNDNYRINTRPEVTFHVPGGGDWSNETIPIDEDYPIIVEWTEVSQEKE